MRIGAPVDKPFRGPSEYSHRKHTYKCSVRGIFQWFQGYETISNENKAVYECYFHGSFIA